MAKKTIIKPYKKSETQIKYENNVILHPLRQLLPKAPSGRTHPIVLPKYISFTIEEDTNKLCLYIQEQEGVCEGKKKTENATYRNMQSDNAAFEGWAVCLKAWLPNIISSVELKWDEPNIDEGDNKWCHYRRFLYRVLRFSEQYDWFEISPYNQHAIECFKKELKYLNNNNFSKIPAPKGDFENLGETAVEFLMANTLSEDIKNQFNLDYVDRQFPVGVRQNGKNFFTGGLSAIDLWGTKNDVLSIIELKYIDTKKQSKNIKVGIISELFMYSCIMRDILNGLIEKPESTPNKHEDTLYREKDKYTRICAYMLANEYHPLVDSQEVINVLNNYSREGNRVVVDFEKSTYQLLSKDKIAFL